MMIMMVLKSRRAILTFGRAMATDWLAKLGKRGFEGLMDNAVKQSVDRVVRDRVEPRLASIENRLASIETRLDISDRLAKLEVEVATVKRER